MAKKAKGANRTRGPDDTVDNLDAMAAALELKRLSEEIARHDVLYYQNDAPEISDADYDGLRARNGALEARFSDLVRSDSPSLRVGVAPAAAFSDRKSVV